MENKKVFLFESKIIFSIGIFFSIPSYSQQSSVDKVGVQVFSKSSGQSVIGTPSSGLVTRSGQEQLSVRIHNSCFGTNLRGTANPVSPDGIITTSLTLEVGGKNIPLSVSYPGELTSRSGMSQSSGIQPMSSSNYSIPGGGLAGIYGNTINLRVPIDVRAKVLADGTIEDTSNQTVRVKNYSFTQEMRSCSGGPAYWFSYGHSVSHPAYPCGSYMGKSGTLSAVLKGIQVASDNSAVDVYVDFPGQTGFCGGYYSPLMLFFSSERPTFKGTSKFPLTPSRNIAWVEPKSPGYFLVMDKKQRGVIERKDQLFGEGNGFKNGFEQLKSLDTNKDGWISSKDNLFPYLYLWQDKNGNGQSEKGELTALSQSVKKISLKYSQGRVHPLGTQAEEREEANFWYISKNGKTKKGKIVDIWLKPL